MSTRTRFIYRGETISLTTISKMLGMSTFNASYLIRNSKDKVEQGSEPHILIIDIFLDTYEEEKQLHTEEVNKKISRLYSLLNEESPIFTGKNKLDIVNQTREKFGFTKPNISDVNSVEDTLDIYYYMVKAGFRGLISKTSLRIPIEYNGVTYPTGVKFYHSLKIVKNTLFKEVLRLDGDVRKAILRVEDDPEFGVTVAPIINGVQYTSIQEAGLILGINDTRYKALYREYKDFDIAYEKYMENSTNFSGKELFPLTVDGQVYSTPSDFADAIEVDIARVRTMYNDGLTFEAMLEQYQQSQQYKELCGGRIKYRTKKDLQDILGVVNSTVNKYMHGGILGKYNILEFIEMTSVYHNDELIIHPLQFTEIFLIPESLIWATKLNIMEMNSNEEKVSYLFRCRDRFIILGITSESPLSHIGNISEDLGSRSGIVANMLFNFDITDDVFAKAIELLKLGFRQPVLIAKNYYNLVDYMVSKSCTSLAGLGELYGLTPVRVSTILNKYPHPLTEEDTKDFITKLEKRKYSIKSISTSIWD